MLAHSHIHARAHARTIGYTILTQTHTHVALTEGNTLLSLSHTHARAHTRTHKWLHYSQTNTHAHTQKASLLAIPALSPFCPLAVPTLQFPHSAPDLITLATPPFNSDQLDETPDAPK